MSTLKKEAAAWQAEKAKKAKTGGAYAIEPDGSHLCQLVVYHASGASQTFRGLSLPEACRKSLEFRDKGYEGAIVAGRP